MTDTTLPTSPTAPVDQDLAAQARPGHGVPSQDPNAGAQFALEPAEAAREAKSVLVGGGIVGGAVLGAGIGVAVAGPVGVVVGGTVGAVAGALGGAAAGGLADPHDPAAAAPPAPSTRKPPTTADSARRSCLLGPAAAAPRRGASPQGLQPTGVCKACRALGGVQGAHAV